LHWCSVSGCALMSLCRFSPVAHVALAALESWVKLGTPASVLAHVLPHLSDYLSASSSPGSADDAQRAAASVQRRALRLLGTMGGDALGVISAPPPPEGPRAAAQAVRWAPEPCLEFVFPFRDYRPTLFLGLCLVSLCTVSMLIFCGFTLSDAMLPRVAELAEVAGDRATKVAACEVLHGLCLVVVGLASQPRVQSREPTEDAFSPLLTHLYPTLLRLAADSDPMPRLLFGPLVVQFVRWLSHPRIRSSADAAAMINALDTALGTAEPAVRTVAARALTEFLHYAVRSAEAAPTDARTVRDRPTQIIERILELARHTSATKRLGAADAINAAYRFLREEPPLLQRFALSLATALLAALRMADADDPAVGTVPALEAALTRFHRIFTNPRTAPLFALPTSAAVAAAAAAPGADTESSEQVVDLPSLARLLWAYSIKPESAARRAAQKMLAVIAPVVSGSAHAWFAASRDRLLAAWEAHSLRQAGGSWPGAGAGEDALVAAQTWLKSLSGALHGRCFALQAFGAPAERLFGSPSLAANLVLFEREWLVRRPGDLTGVTQRLLRPHCDVVLGLLQAFALSTRATDGAPPQSLMSPAVLRAAALVTLQPWELGLDVGSADLVTQVLLCIVSLSSSLLTPCATAAQPRSRTVQPHGTHVRKQSGAVLRDSARGQQQLRRHHSRCVVPASWAGSTAGCLLCPRSPHACPCPTSHFARHRHRPSSPRCAAGCPRAGCLRSISLCGCAAADAGGRGSGPRRPVAGVALWLGRC
jgi:hypothetical protein